MNDQELQERIVRDPEAPRGKPIIRGTRVSVWLIVGFIEAGETPEEIVDDYPDLTIEDVEAALAYARAGRTAFRDAGRRRSVTRYLSTPISRSRSRSTLHERCGSMSSRLGAGSWARSIERS